jgi:hypothetical protein
MSKGEGRKRERGLKMSELSEVYVEAAKLVDGYKVLYSCTAIKLVCKQTKSYYDVPEVKLYLKIMNLGHDISNPSRNAVFLWSCEDARELRVLLLCMMAACCDDFVAEEKKAKAKAKVK